MNDFIFGAYPYIAGVVFILGSWLRFDREQYTWKADSSQLLSNGNMRIASNLFHVGVLAIFGGHFVGLLTPHSWFTAMGVSDLAHQYVAIYAGIVFGGMCFVGALMLTIRRLTNERVAAVSRTRDNFIIIWILVTVTIGLSTIPTSMGHASSGDASVMVALTQYVQSIVALSPTPALLDGVDSVYKAHMFFGMTLFLLFPFTRLVHVWSVPVGYLGRAYQIVRRRHITMN